MHNIAIFSTEDDKLVRSILTCKKHKAKIKIIISNLPNSHVSQVAKRYGIRYMCFDNTLYLDRKSHEKDIVSILKKEKIDLIIFAHYMRLITKYFVSRYRNKIINIHPSLLPDFKGANGYEDAFKAGVEKSGCTIHYVDEGLDTGSIILQKEVPLLPEDNFHTFRDRIHEAECSAINAFMLSVVV